MDGMGGDRAPDEIVAGARLASEEFGIAVTLVGPPGRLAGCGLPVIAASEVIEMHEDAGRGVRTKKDSSLLRAAEAVRDGRAAAMVSAGNTGATMASALLRMGRIKGVGRPAIATPVPVPGSTPTVLLDAGANAECTPTMLVQFAQMGSAFARERFGLAKPRVGLLSIGEEDSKGSPLVKETHALLAGGAAGADVLFLGNVEGRDVMTDAVDVIVTDGFTGNVVLKTLEGGINVIVERVLAVLDSTAEIREVAGPILSALAPLATEMNPETYGGALLLGVEGVCVISHGSSSARAVANAIKVARDAVDHDLVGQLRAAIS